MVPPVYPGSSIYDCLKEITYSTPSSSKDSIHQPAQAPTWYSITSTHSHLPHCFTHHTVITAITSFHKFFLFLKISISPSPSFNDVIHHSIQSLHRPLHPTQLILHLPPSFHSPASSHHHYHHGPTLPPHLCPTLIASGARPPPARHVRALIMTTRGNGGQMIGLIR